MLASASGVLSANNHSNSSVDAYEAMLAIALLLNPDFWGKCG